MTEQEYKAFFGSSVEIDKLINNVLKPILGEFVENPASVTDYASKKDYELLAASANIHSIFHKGDFSVGAGDDVAVFEVVLKDNCNITRARKGIQEIVRRLIKDVKVGAFIIFHYRSVSGRLDKETWRFSWVEKTGTEAAATSAKRYTYLCGPSYSCRTIAERFVELEKKVKEHTFDSSDITAAFDVEALSDEFFYNFRAIYSKIKCEGEKWKSKKYTTPYAKLSDIKNDKDLGFCDFIERYKNDTRYFGEEFTRWESKLLRDYIKKMMGRLVFLQFLQKKGWMCGNPNYLKSLFEKFVQGKRENVTDTAPGSFLDEVLEPLFFGVLNTKAKDREELFKNKKWNLDLLNEWKDIPYLNGGLFEQEVYDEPKSAFPNVLFNELFTLFSEYNFTIDENDPDDKEVGIDPEMLSKIFESQLEDNKDKGAFYTPKEIVEYMCKESLIAYLQTDITDEGQKENIRSFVCDREAALQDGLRLSVAEKLKNVKICDPAIGSGAFPMGMLNLLVSTREKIESVQNRLELKKEIICNNLYGVDIEKGAVDIARLRFWLSLVIDEEKPAALPNLDYKIMQGNSLLEQYEGVDLSGMSLNEQAKSKAKKGQSWQQTLVFDEQGALDNIQNAIRESFATEDHNKKSELREIINENIKNYIYNLKGCTPEIQQKLTELPIPNDQFFLWHIYFKEVFDKGGFDIVIGNPPYVDYREIDNRTRIETKNYDLYYKSNRPNLFLFFVELAIRNLTANGFLTYINPLSMLSTDSAYGLRKMLFENGCVDWINDVSMFRIFADVNTYPIVWGYSKTNHKKKNVLINKCLSYGNLGQYSFDIKNELIEKDEKKRIPTNKNALLVIKIERAKSTLKSISTLKWGTSASGYGKRKISISKYNSLPINQQQQYAPIVQTADIKKYAINWKGEYIPISIFSNAIVNKFNDNKILVGRVTKVLQVAYDIKSFYVGKATLITDIKGFDYFYILGLLNSKLATFWYTAKFDSTHMANGYIRYDIPYLEQMPIMKCDGSLLNELVNFVKIIFNAKQSNPQADTSVEETLIDILVYLLYNLTFEEVQIVDKEFSVKEMVYSQWLANYQNDGTLPAEEEMRAALGC